MLHQALETALDENIIPSRLREELEQILAHLREMAGVSPEDDPLHQIKLQPVKVRKIGEAAGLEAPSDGGGIPVQGTLEEMERKIILAAYEQHGHNKKATARTLGINIKTLRARLAAYGVGEGGEE